ncbi:DUF998 domain-containing protein [Mycobacterium crocinum]|uniref:DUF998 domain-containing protein n=1 Tax=Mycolicibacterium crocinum TaxID=388459 RepID=A0ABY3TLT0_9MYCO|nr:DUF998 domain-containing protein [Mycolicibacterium crocinum]MCV7213828.1 DUF998 domain-containing protein [Mycolicibacterium crocinum]ULN41271.1 DUF998 domain-containing protein [Mycolicibacterium crocinum]
MSATDCPPLDIRVTKSLLGYGVIAGPIYVVTAAVQAATRSGFDPTRHAVSQLANGSLGWIQIANFVVTGAMTVAAAVGMRRALGPSRLGAWASALLIGYSVALVVAGAFRADPSDGFPPGTPAGVGTLSWHGAVHFGVAAIGFACLVGACWVFGAWFSREGQNGWAWFSRVTGVAFAASFMALGSGQGGAAAILAFTAAVILAWAWLSLVSVKLYRRA